MRPLILDIETNGFNPDVIWTCVVMYGTEVFEFTDAPSFNNFLKELPDHVEVFAHNGLSFDYPILSRLWGTDWSRFTLRDSLVMSRLAEPSRVGGHSLAAWGDRLGFPKGDHTDWTRYSPEMSAYCRQDVAVTERLLKVLEPQLSGFDEESLNLEHDTARIIADQRARGWLLHEQGCHTLLATLKERQFTLEDEVRETFRPLYAKTREYTPRPTQGGFWNRSSCGPLKDTPELVGGKFTSIRLEPFNLGSRRQIGKYLQRFGWKPTAFTETGQPIVDEGTLERIEGIPQAKLISEFLMVQKRVAQVQSWLDAMDDDGRVHGSVNPCGAVTGRMTHSKPNVAQVPAARAPYGKECRSVWTVPEGYKLVGCDASGLELRCLAHYMNDPDYTRTVCEGKQEDGTDVHTVNQHAAGLATRDQAKTFIYAFLYGAGDAKVGEIVGKGRQAGKALKEEFLRKTPALAALRENVVRAAAKGYLKGIDGRKLWVRSEHAALNTLLQGAGAIIMKRVHFCLKFIVNVPYESIV